MIRKTEKRLRLCCALLCLELLFIWGNSLLPGQMSAALSQWVKELLYTLFPFLPIGGAGHGLLRKTAHFLEFALLGGSLAWLWGMLRTQRARVLLPSLLCGIGAACLDEGIQFFVPGRVCSVWDVLIDSSGVILGLAALFLGCQFKHKRSK